MNRSHATRAAVLTATAALAISTGCGAAEEAEGTSTVGPSSVEPAPLCSKGTPVDDPTVGYRVHRR